MVNSYIMYININVQEGHHKTDPLSHHDFCKSISLSWIYPEAVHYSKLISLSKNIGRYTEDSSVVSTITMDTFNSSKNRDMEVNHASVASTSKLFIIRLDTTLDYYLDIGKKSARYSVHRWIFIES